MAVPGYVRRIARLLDVFEQLEAHPDGVAIEQLAAECGIDPAELREDLLAYYTADPAIWLGLTRRHVLEWSSPDVDPDELDPRDAVMVRLVDQPQDLGVEHLDAGELALVYTAAVAALDLAGPEGDPALAEAIDVIAETMFGQAGAGGAPGGWRPPYLAELQRASSERRKVRIVYSRQWETGVFERVVEPWRLVQTTVRGWELDAGPVRENGRLRTYLLSNIRSVEVLEETFTTPPEADRLLAEQRATRRVRIRLPHRARWSLDEYAESSVVVAETDDTFTADLELLEPVGWRVGLLMLAGGEETCVLEPAGMVTEGPALARRLLAHHTGRVS